MDKMKSISTKHFNTLSTESLRKLNLFNDHIEKETWKYVSLYYSYWNDELIENFEEYIEWNNLSLNRNMVWDIDLLEKYKEKINWSMFSKAFFTSDIEADIKRKAEILTYFEQELDWYILSKDILNIPPEIIIMFRHKLNWEQIITDTFVHLTFETIENIIEYLLEIDLDKILKSHIFTGLCLESADSVMEQLYDGPSDKYDQCPSLECLNNYNSFNIF